MSEPVAKSPPRRALPATSRYEALLRIASGGMGTVYLGRLVGAAGFTRLVAIKRAHPHLVEAPAFRRSVLEEAELASRVSHPNVVGVLDVEEVDDELLLIMEYIEGASLSQLLRAVDGPLPTRLAVRILLDTCAGLQATHEVADDAGRPLRLVHRDVSPQNVLVGADGTSRLADFGTAKALDASTAHNTTTGVVKGKLSYMAPEYVSGERLDACSDVFSMGVVAWEMLTGERLFEGANPLEAIKSLLTAEIASPSSRVPSLSPAFDAAVLKALERQPAARFSSARAFAEALESAAVSAGGVASAVEVGALVRERLGEVLTERRAQLRASDRASREALEDAKPRPREEPTSALHAVALPESDTVLETVSPGAEQEAPGTRPARRWRGVTAAVVAVGALTTTTAGFLYGRTSGDPRSAGAPPGVSASDAAPPSPPTAAPVAEPLAPPVRTADTAVPDASRSERALPVAGHPTRVPTGGSAASSAARAGAVVDAAPPTHAPPNPYDPPGGPH
jgi:eukaryotic-like serine/threonine-protein kinase